MSIKINREVRTFIWPLIRKKSVRNGIYFNKSGVKPSPKVKLSEWHWGLRNSEFKLVERKYFKNPMRKQV